MEAPASEQRAVVNYRLLRYLGLRLTRANEECGLRSGFISGHLCCAAFSRVVGACEYRLQFTPNQVYQVLASILPLSKKPRCEGSDVVLNSDSVWGDSLQRRTSRANESVPVRLVKPSIVNDCQNRSDSIFESDLLALFVG